MDAADRARQAGRLAESSDPLAVATRYWAAGHGLAMLVVTGVLPAEALALHGPELAVAAFVAAGDEPALCRASVLSAWSDAGPEPGTPGRLTRRRDDPAGP